MSVDPWLVAKVKGFEGFKPQPYWDVRQWTSGYGTRGRQGETVTPEVAEQRLNDELAKAQAIVDGFHPGLPQGTRNALTSLTFNAGADWTTGGLGEAVKSGDVNLIRDRFLQYNKAGGEYLPGLANRRQAEAEWFGAVPADTGPTDPGYVPPDYDPAAPSVANGNAAPATDGKLDDMIASLFGNGGSEAPAQKSGAEQALEALGDLPPAQFAQITGKPKPVDVSHLREAILRRAQMRRLG